jgi:hypothetical protein
MLKTAMFKTAMCKAASTRKALATFLLVASSLLVSQTASADMGQYLILSAQYATSGAIST